VRIIKIGQSEFSFLGLHIRVEIRERTQNGICIQIGSTVVIDQIGSSGLESLA